MMLKWWLWLVVTVSKSFRWEFLKQILYVFQLELVRKFVSVVVFGNLDGWFWKCCITLLVVGWVILKVYFTGLIAAVIKLWFWLCFFWMSVCVSKYLKWKKIFFYQFLKNIFVGIDKSYFELCLLIVGFMHTLLLISNKTFCSPKCVLRGDRVRVKISQIHSFTVIFRWQGYRGTR